MEVFRLTRKKHATQLSGKGAAKRGARWNSKGNEIIYTASNRALAMAEVAVHFSYAAVLDDYQMITIFIPDNLHIEQFDKSILSDNWLVHPPLESTKKIGDIFLKSNNKCLLKVPSAVVMDDYNVLINPKHKDFDNIKILDIKDFKFDMRLF